jgi:hypothetical protein
MVLVETLTQGGVRSCCASLALGYDSVARVLKGTSDLPPLHLSKNDQSPRCQLAGALEFGRSSRIVPAGCRDRRPPARPEPT